MSLSNLDQKTTISCILSAITQIKTLISNLDTSSQALLLFHLNNITTNLIKFDPRFQNNYGSVNVDKVVNKLNNINPNELNSLLDDVNKATSPTPDPSDPSQITHNTTSHNNNHDRSKTSGKLHVNTNNRTHV